MSEREINQIEYIVRTSFALGYAKGRGGEFDQGPELEHMIQQTLEMLGLAAGRPAEAPAGADLPTMRHTVIVTNDGREAIEAVVDGVTH